MKLCCAICEKRISYGWYCYSCYKKYKSDIESNEPWTRFVQNEEKRRRREKRYLVHLGESETGDGELWQAGNQRDTI